MDAAIFTERQANFVLWGITQSDAPPKLIIGQLKDGAPTAVIGEREFVLRQSRHFPDLWMIAAADCGLKEGQTYHYWFEVTDTHPARGGQRIRITDPMAYTVDWHVTAPQPEAPGYTDADRYPPAVISLRQSQLVPCDAGGEPCETRDDTTLSALPANSRLVIYELPTAWSRGGPRRQYEMALGTFRDVTALLDEMEIGSNFTDLDVTQQKHPYLVELGVNAIELCPPADSFYIRQWGYGTTNFFAPDFELGFPGEYTWSAANHDLRALIAACHAHGMRFFADVVMAFSKAHAYRAAAGNRFFIFEPWNELTSPDAHNSRPRARDTDNLRNGFGSDLFRYAALADGYDPVSGERKNLYPARQLMKASLLRWMNDFHIDGIRMDSVENVANWDFIQEYKDLAHQAWRHRFGVQEPTSSVDDRFLVVGEELTEPLGLLDKNTPRLDALWNERFKKHLRAALLGQNAEGEPSFEWTVRKAIDCRNLGYQDGAQAVIYLTSHDVEGWRNERLFNLLLNNGVADAERRIKLGFACLLTAVGIPMILAGEEFADEHDLFGAKGNVTQGGGKQMDPVNYSRLQGDENDWRRRIKQYVARLIKFRTTSDALAVNDTEFIHVDFHEGKRVLAWRRGGPGHKPVVVVANFSDYGTPGAGSPWAEYRVRNWPATPAGAHWEEISQGRADPKIPPEWVGREPIYPWEAKVYTLV